MAEVGPPLAQTEHEAVHVIQLEQAVVQGSLAASLDKRLQRLAGLLLKGRAAAAQVQLELQVQAAALGAREGVQLFVGELPDARGADALGVVIKGSFGLDGAPLSPDQQAPVEPADRYTGEPGRSSLAAAGEVHPCRPATDVLLVGRAHAPGGEPVTELALSLRVGPIKRTLRVVGDRCWQKSGGGLEPSAPAPFFAMPLVWERAFGGPEVAENPVGLGAANGRTDDEHAGAPLPNLERPEAPLVSPGDPPMPACTGPVAPGWAPRAALGGTYDEAWRRQRAPYLPEDFDPRFLNVAPAEQVAPGYLRGGEAVALSGASPAGELALTLPTVTPRVEVELAGRAEAPDVHLEAVLLEPDLGRLCLLWRATVPCDGEVSRIRSIVVQGGR